jgi:hypothetical protein
MYCPTPRQEKVQYASVSANPGKKVRLSMRDLVVTNAYLCDARERDLSRLDVGGGAVRLVMQGNIATVRLICD